MKCLCCGQELSKENDNSSQWHLRCIRRFFGMSVMPDIDVSKEFLDDMANETANKGITVTGVQKKLSLHLSRVNGAKLTIVNYPTGYILKPQAPEYAHLPEYEHVTMCMADSVGIKTVPHALAKTEDTLSYITKRVDRNISGNEVHKYAMEDFCQLAGRLTSDKYRGSYEQCGRLIKKYSSRVGFDISEFYLRVVFSFITGNSDMHLKNFSIIEDMPGNEQFHLSQAYDLLPVNLILPEDTEETALTLNGKKRSITYNDIMTFAENIGLEKKTARRITDSLISAFNVCFRIIDDSFLNEHEKQAYKDLITMRIDRIAK